MGWEMITEITDYKQTTLDRWYYIRIKARNASSREIERVLKALPQGAVIQ